jgi:excisionase family DNA binding protein
MKTQPDSVPTPVPSDDVLMTPTEACKYLSISRVSLWKLTKEGTLPCIRLSRRIKRFHRADILALSQPAQPAQ